MHPHTNCPLCAAKAMFEKNTQEERATLPPLATLEDVTAALLKSSGAPCRQDQAAWLMARFEIRRR